MRDVDPTIVIVGPDLSLYDDVIMNELTTRANNIANDICGIMKKNNDPTETDYIGPDGNKHLLRELHKSKAHQTAWMARPSTGPNN